MKPSIEQLETRTIPSLAPSAQGVLTATFDGTTLSAVGSGLHAPATVTILDADSRAVALWKPFGEGFTGGARVAVADLDGDQYEEIIVGSGPGAPATVFVYDGRGLNHLYYHQGIERVEQTLRAAFHPFGNFTGGCFVAGSEGKVWVAADAGGGPQVASFTPTGVLLDSFYAYDPSFRGGVRIAADGDQLVTTPGAGMASLVRIYSTEGELIQSFLAFPLTYLGGSTVACGDLNGDGKPEIICGMEEGNTVYLRQGDGSSSMFSLPYLSSQGGVRVGIAICRTGDTAVEPVVRLAWTDVPFYITLRGEDVARGSIAPYAYGWIPPGLYSLLPGDPTHLFPFLPAAGGWVA